MLTQWDDRSFFFLSSVVIPSRRAGARLMRMRKRDVGDRFLHPVFLVVTILLALKKACVSAVEKLVRHVLTFAHFCRPKGLQ